MERAPTSNYGPVRCGPASRPGIPHARPGHASTWSRVKFVSLSIVLWLSVLILSVGAQQRFPPPDFESGHKIPLTQVPAARAIWLQYLDVAVLVACLWAATRLVHRNRSRKGLVALSLFSLAYFGFWRKGCVCAIGSVQNISLGLFDSGYAIPFSVVAFFVLPIAVALFFGRTFCAAVCPHGALQDLVLLKPIRIPDWLEQGLGVLPFIYLGAGVLLAATGSAFIICQYDPFVPIFRLSGRSVMVLSGAALLALGVFVGRPYCRFLCPYGALLKLGATVTRWRVRVTPDRCTQCRLCEKSCPFGALRTPTVPEISSGAMAKDRRRLAMLLLLLPVLVAAGGWTGHQFSGTAARVHPTVSLAERLLREKDSPAKTGPLTPEDLSLGRAREHSTDLLLEAKSIRHKIDIGSWIFGAWIGVVVGIKLISLAVHRRQQDYEPGPGECFGCARCFESCPSELIRRGIVPAPAPETGETAELTPGLHPQVSGKG